VQISDYKGSENQLAALLLHFEHPQVSLHLINIKGKLFMNSRIPARSVKSLYLSGVEP